MRASGLPGAPAPLVSTQALSLRIGAEEPALASLRAGKMPAAAQSLTSLTLAVFPGDRIALTGPSGSGKSVLLRTLALLDPPMAGVVCYRGAPVAPQAVPGFRRAIAYLPQRPALGDETVRDALQQPFTLKAQQPRCYDEAQVLHWLTLAGKPASFLDKATANLSGGEQQVAALVRTLATAPEVLLLDEPTAALDPDSAAAIESVIAGWMHSAPDRQACVWISHDPAQSQRVGRQHWRTGEGCLTVLPGHQEAAS